MSTGTDNPVVLIPTDLGVASYIEVIIVNKKLSTAGLNGQSYDISDGASIIRDLYRLDEPVLVKNVLAWKLTRTTKTTSDYVPYTLNINTWETTEVSFGASITNRCCLLFIDQMIGPGELLFIISNLRRRRMVLPMRVYP